MGEALHLAGGVLVTLNQKKPWDELEYELGLAEPSLIVNDGIVLALNAGLGLEANIAKICATALVMVYNFVTRKIFLEGDETK